MLHLSESFTHNGIKVPALTPLTGTARIQSNRIHITIAHISLNNMLMPVKLNVYGSDKSEGLPLDKSSITTDRMERKATARLRRRVPALPLVQDIAEGAVGVAEDINRKRKSTITLPSNYTVYLTILE